MNEDQEPNIYVERLDSPTKRETNLLFQVFEWKLISADLFKAIVGLTPEEYKDGDKSIDVREELHLFVDRFFSFESTARIPIRKAYEAYREYYGFDDDQTDESLTQQKFTRWILKSFGNHLTETVARVDGKPTRCFAGAKLLTLDDIATD